MTEPALKSQELCYLSTPEHNRSFVGKFIYIYTDKGTLTLTKSALQFEKSSGLVMVIPLASIGNIEIGEYSRWAKPGEPWKR